VQNFALKFQANPEKTSKKFRGLLFCRTRPVVYSLRRRLNSPVSQQNIQNITDTNKETRSSISKATDKRK